MFSKRKMQQVIKEQSECIVQLKRKLLLHEEERKVFEFDSDAHKSIVSVTNEEMLELIKENKELKERISKQSSEDILEIRLKDLDSVPIVYYKGDRLDKALVDLSYHWETSNFNTGYGGANDINIEYYSPINGKSFDKKTIGHKRVK